MTETPALPSLQGFVDDVDRVVRSSKGQYEVTERIAPLLSDLLAGDFRLPPAYVTPSPDRHLNYLLHLAPDQSWSLVSVVWDVGQRTPVHGHETWGVVGIYAGAEREIRYLKPAAGAAPEPLTTAGEQVFEPGQVTVCCTTDDDVHAVAAVGDEPTVGLHVYGGNLAGLRRPSYDPATGAVQWFASEWDDPPVGADQSSALVRPDA